MHLKKACRFLHNHKPSPRCDAIDDIAYRKELKNHPHIDYDGITRIISRSFIRDENQLDLYFVLIFPF